MAQMHVEPDLGERHQGSLLLTLPELRCVSVERFAELCRENIARLMDQATDERRTEDERNRARRQIRQWEKNFRRSRRSKIPPAEG